MTRKLMTLEKLKIHCQRNDIFIPRGVKREYLVSAIIRHAYDGKKFRTKNCFGWWEKDNSTCLYCDYENQCFEVAIGMTKEEYFKKIERVHSD